MNSLVLYHPPGRDLRSTGQHEDGGGEVEDILKRLGKVESDVSDIKLELNTVLTTLPHLATKSDLAELRTEMSTGFGTLRTEMAEGIGALRTEMTEAIGALRTEMTAANGQLRTDMAARETAFIKWMIATVLTVAGVAFSIAKFVH